MPTTPSSRKAAYVARLVDLTKQFAATQTISGTGACSLAGMFFALIYGVQSKTVFLPNPTWANHIPIFRRAGFNVQHYAYFNPSNCSLNLQGMLEDISVAPPPSRI